MGHLCETTGYDVGNTEAIALQNNCHDVNDVNDLILGTNLLDWCNGLLTENVATGVVTFLHTDIERYFRDTKTSPKIQEWFPDGQQRIVETCLKCLLLDDPDFEETSPLWRYAARHWGHHVEDKYIELEPLIT